MPQEAWSEKRPSIGPRGRTRDQLYEEARDMNIEGRSQMSKEQLRRAVDRKRAS